jgi:hypothetical protein
MATVIHFGEDICFRLPVLKYAGYAVEECDSMERFSSLLRWNPDAVLLEEEPLVPVFEASSLARTQSSASLVLFRHAILGGVPHHDFDLIIPPLTTPEEWLTDIAALLERSRVIRTQSEALHRQSAALRQNSAAVRELTREIRDQSLRQRSHIAKQHRGKVDPPAE